MPLRDFPIFGLVVLTVDNGITPYIVHGILFVNAEPRLPNDDTKLAFIVQGLCEACMRINFLTAGDNTRGPLGEDDRVCCYECQLCINNGRN